MEKKGMAAYPTRARSPISEMRRKVESCRLYSLRLRRRRSSDCVRNLMSPSQLEAHRCAMPSAAVAPFMEGKGISPVGVTC